MTAGTLVLDRDLALGYAVDDYAFGHDTSTGEVCVECDLCWLQIEVMPTTLFGGLDTAVAEELDRQGWTFMKRGRWICSEHTPASAAATFAARDARLAPHRLSGVPPF